MGLGGTRQQPCPPHSLLFPPSPSPFPASASMLHSFAGAPLPSHAAVALRSDQAGGHPRGLGVCWTAQAEHRAPLLPPQALLPQPVALLPLRGDRCRVGWFTSRSSGFRPVSFLKANKAVIFAKEELPTRVLRLSDERYIPSSL